MEPDDLSTLQLLLVAARLARRQSAACLITIGLPLMGFHILQHLAERSPIRQAELATLVLASGQTTGFVLTKLERNHWITRQRGLAHNRFVVSITDEGRSILDIAQERVQTLEIPIDAEALRPALTTIIRRAATWPEVAQSPGCAGQ
ncbi:MarR family winged helix-turn-helix transcriptional regulator [Arthrobacter sp. TmT3-37]